MDKKEKNSSGVGAESPFLAPRSRCCNAPIFFVYEGGPVCTKCDKWTVTEREAETDSQVDGSLVGRELDAAVAEHVMNVVCNGERTPDHSKWCSRHGTGERVGAPFYSTDIAAAMEVVEKLRHTYGVEINGAPDGAGWWVTFESKVFRLAAAAGPDLPDVICRAALQAVNAPARETGT